MTSAMVGLYVLSLVHCSIAKNKKMAATIAKTMRRVVTVKF